MPPPCQPGLGPPLPGRGTAAAAAGSESLCLQTQALRFVEIAEVKKQHVTAPSPHGRKCCDPKAPLADATGTSKLGQPGCGHWWNVSHRAGGSMGWGQQPPFGGAGVREGKCKREKARNELACSRERERN